MSRCVSGGRWWGRDGASKRRDAACHGLRPGGQGGMLRYSSHHPGPTSALRMRPGHGPWCERSFVTGERGGNQRGPRAPVCFRGRAVRSGMACRKGAMPHATGFARGGRAECCGIRRTIPAPPAHCGCARVTDLGVNVQSLLARGPDRVRSATTAARHQSRAVPAIGCIGSCRRPNPVGPDVPHSPSGRIGHPPRLGPTSTHNPRKAY